MHLGHGIWEENKAQYSYFFYVFRTSDSFLVLCRNVWVVTSLMDGLDEFDRGHEEIIESKEALHFWIASRSVSPLAWK
jgi:hypothetical protein